MAVELLRIVLPSTTRLSQINTKGFTVNAASDCASTKPYGCSKHEPRELTPTVEPDLEKVYSCCSCRDARYARYDRGKTLVHARHVFRFHSYVLPTP